METIQLIGRRWFEKTNGNTYHSVEAYVDNKFIGKVAFEYGYGSQWSWTGARLLEEKGLISLKKFDNGGRESLWTYCENNNIKLLESVSDVKRKKDL